jgi:hypothetical protein
MVPFRGEIPPFFVFDIYYDASEQFSVNNKFISFLSVCRMPIITFDPGVRVMIEKSGKSALFTAGRNHDEMRDV